MFTPYRGSRTISAIVRTAKHTHMPYGGAFYANRGLELMQIMG